MDITKRFNRILSIYFHLQSRPIIKAQELSDQFNVSLRTVYRDIKALEEAGVPIIGEAGTGYSLLRSYKMPPIRFSADEALSFGVAQKLMNHYLDRTISDHFSSALLKMKSVLQYDDKEHLANIEDKVIIKKSRNFLNKNVPEALAILFEGIARKLQIQIHYVSVANNSPIERMVEVVGVFQESHYWYFMAYCHYRKEVRQFRLDRIKDIRLTTIGCQQELLPLKAYLDKHSDRSDFIKIRIRVSKSMAKYMYWERNNFGFVEEIDDQENVLMLFHYSSNLEYFSRWLLMFIDEVNIIEPDELKIRAKELLESSLARIVKD